MKTIIQLEVAQAKFIFDKYPGPIQIFDEDGYSCITQLDSEELEDLLDWLKSKSKSIYETVVEQI